jgi:hypothetical protein
MKDKGTQHLLIEDKIYIIGLSTGQNIIGNDETYSTLNTELSL